MHFFYCPVKHRVLIRRHNTPAIRLTEAGVRRRLEHLARQVARIDSIVLMMRVCLCWKGYDYLMRWLRAHQVKDVYGVFKVENVELVDGDTLTHPWGSCRVAESPFNRAQIQGGRILIKFQDGKKQQVHTEGNFPSQIN